MIVTQTHFESIPFFRRGKVRDVYDLDPYLLIVATDRISAFDVIMPNPIPEKGIVLNRISEFWFEQTKIIVNNHVITSDVDDYPSVCKPYTEQLRGRSMIVHKTIPLPVECIVRGYLSGSGWKEYRQSQSVCGIKLPAGLRESERLAEPIFTPSTKAEAGHDQNITFEDMCKILGNDLSEKIRYTSIAVYEYAQDIAIRKGIIIADTKMEFGLLNNDLILIDELLTPDSSRFWPSDHYIPGRSQSSYDKQFLRDYLISVKWNQCPPAPELPPEVILKTREKYQQALQVLTS